MGRDPRHLVNTAHHLTERGIGFKVSTAWGAAINTTTASVKLVSPSTTTTPTSEEELPKALCAPEEVVPADHSPAG